MRGNTDQKTPSTNSFHAMYFTIDIFVILIEIINFNLVFANFSNFPILKVSCETKSHFSICAVKKIPKVYTRIN